MPDQLVCVIVVVGTAMVVSGLEEIWQLGGGALGGVLLHPGEAGIARGGGAAPSHQKVAGVGNRDAAALPAICNIKDSPVFLLSPCLVRKNKLL